MNKELSNYIADPKNANANLELADAYWNEGQLAPACSFYLRAAELAGRTNSNLSYKAQLKLAVCLDRAGDRNNSVKGVLLRAIGYRPDRPEAYFLLSKVYEKLKEWHECYAISKVAFVAVKDTITSMGFDYDGMYTIEFQIALSAWKIGLYKESIESFNKILSYGEQLIAPVYSETIKNNLKEIDRLLQLST